ncbi:hypothetical protein [Oenococcus oeni]|uniref:hypothetical protein n=1 Tax=Oenococcus oeni TaxID=1247 RepID=UPI001EF9C954|nr:hypothetical protein [Oenococcus oeni]
MVDSTPNVTTGEVDTQAVQLDVWDSWPLQNAQTGAAQSITINGKSIKLLLPWPAGLIPGRMVIFIFFIKMMMDLLLLINGKAVGRSFQVFRLM